MKKLIWTVVIFGFLISKSYSQSIGNIEESNTDSRDLLQIGFKAGINVSNVYDAQGEQFKADPKIGFVGGAFLSIPIGTYLGFQPEVLFSQKGFKAKGVFLGNNYEFTRTTNYLDIPLLLALKPTESLTILVGPQYSFLMKQTDVFSNAILTGTAEQEFENDNIRKNTLCFLGGVDVKMSQLVLGVRVGWDILNNNGDGTSTTPRYKNFWYQFTLGIKI